MSKEQIDEMARIIDDNHGFIVSSVETAKALYNAGYRKQSEGEWVKTETHSYCSVCKGNVISWSGEYDGYERERGICLMKYCPHCGAKMKGEQEKWN